MGWTSNYNLNLGVSLVSSEGVIGQTDGASQTYTTNDKLGYYHFSEDSEWRNDLFLREATTKTPSVPRFVKSDDELKLSTIYLHNLPNTPKVGPYARAEAAAPMFKGEDVRPAVSSYSVHHRNGTIDAPFSASSLRLTDGFKPLTTKQAAGFFYRPVSEEKVKVETRLGIAAQQISAAGQFAVSGTDSSGNLQVDELRDVSQAGLEVAASVKGAIDEKTSYEAGADAMTPFVNNKAAGDRRNAWRLTNIDGYAKLTSKITSWASFGYDYKLTIQPQLVDRAQQIHMAVLTINYPTTPGKKE
jgi:hypothetical protein